MNTVFYISAAIAIITTFLAISRLNAIHALLHLIVSLLAVAVIFYTLGAPFVAALEVIVYAGAIMVVFVFVVMMLNAGDEITGQEREWLRPQTWIAPAIFTALLLAELIYLLLTPGTKPLGQHAVNPKQVGLALFGPYLLGVELASLLLMSGLVGAYHLGFRRRRQSDEGGDA
jgi:NADH-quinone oxidoreductase subunit J